MRLRLLKVEQSAFTRAFFLSMSDIHKYSTWSLNSPIFSWQTDSRLWIITQLVNEFGHKFCHFVWYVEVKMASVEVKWLFSEDIAFACYFVAPHLPPPYRSASGIGYASKNYLKWWEIQLAIQCRTDTVNSYRFVKKHVQEAQVILKINWIEYFKTVFLNIYNCMCKTLFANAVTNSLVFIV